MSPERPCPNAVHIPIALLLLTALAPCQPHAQELAAPPPERHRIFSHLMDPPEHPDYERHAVKPPSWETFKGRTQFTCLRSFDVQDGKVVGYAEEMEKFSRTYDLGNVIWPSYPILFATNLMDLADEIKHRDLYLFDVWGYVPGSGPGGYWQQFKPTPDVFGMLESRLGDHWLGTDIGEQDGRYIGGYANQMTPASAGRLEQFLNFQRHFERMSDDLGHKHAALVSLNFGHYLLKEGTYTLIGAETAQGLPNNQVYYAFIRGAGKQYGVPWFGNASIFNRWGFKTYGSAGRSDGYDHGPTKGTSLSLLKRLLYTHILYNCVAVGFENGWLDGKELSPIGRIQQAAQRWVKEHGQPGVLQTPVALLLDFYSGWSFPRHLYSENLYRVWGNLPYQEGDYLTDAILDLLYPGYQNSSYFHDESGFIAPTPYGDLADCLLSDAPGWLLERYPLVVVAGDLRGGAEISHKLAAYVSGGGHLILTSGNLAKLPQGLAGLTNVSTTTFQTNIGQGRLTVLPGEFGVESVAQEAIRSEIDQPLASPYRLRSDVRSALEEAFRDQQLFDVGNQKLSFVTTRKGSGKYLVGLANNSWREQPFKITSHIGQIKSLTELPLDQSEKGAPGHLPEGVPPDSLGRSTPATVAGGDIRIFSVEVEEAGVVEIPLIPAPTRPEGRFLSLRNCVSIQQAILSHPTFFEHYDGVVVSWEYLRDRESLSLQREAAWLARQRVRILVDVCPDLYPTLRLINNLPADYAASMAALADVMDKMKILGSGDLLVSLHRFPENNFSGEQTLNAFEKTFRTLSEQCRQRGITLYLRQTFGKPPWNLTEAGRLLDQWKIPNLRLAASVALLPGRNPLQEEVALLRRHLGLWLVAGSRNDVTGKPWDTHLPFHQATEVQQIARWLAVVPGSPMALDGIYESESSEFMDITTIERSLNR